MAQRRTYFGDVKPYAVPGSLAALQGPSSGIITLPLWVYWAPGERSFDVGTHIGAKQVYTAVLSEGALDEVCKMVNLQRLVQVWPTLVLPRRAQTLWEQRFPELKAG
ncbi:transcriptional regulator [Kocuria sp.]|uniref:transcriptional regulator n=1 Tax=Kocuria sp. TaxID=1871328 RepID=UPI0026E0005D|nr:transcriptional regulator [Kocuria sp.]MDO5617950.1 transcriptional regulator [Kocuria sp.]